MKFIKPLILESKNIGIIYHFTGIYNIYEMLRKNDFLLKTDMKYTSFTRNPSMFSPELLQSKLQVRITIDGNKLSNKYNIFPKLDNVNKLHRIHGEDEERIQSKNIDIEECILQIDIMDEPMFRSKEDIFYKRSASSFKYEPNSYIDDSNVEKIINKHQYFLNKIEELKFSKFPINIVSKFVNLKYQSKFIIKTLG